MDGNEKALVSSQPGVGRPGKQIGNTIVFPKELRDAIPTHSARVLEFDRVTGAVNRSWVQASPEWLRALGYPPMRPRAQINLLAHETGQLTGQFEIGIDLDADTMRALGEFLVQLADQAIATI
jgi:hypothetical protein